MRQAVIRILAVMSLGACGDAKPLGPHDQESSESDSVPPSGSTANGSIADAGGTTTMSDGSIADAGGTTTMSDGSIADMDANASFSSSATETQPDCIMMGALEELDICVYELPDLSADPDLFLSELTVLYYPDGSTRTHEILQTTDATVLCSLGWTVDDPTAPTTIELCTETCELIQADKLARLEFRIGCYSRE